MLDMVLVLPTDNSSRLARAVEREAAVIFKEGADRARRTSSFQDKTGATRRAVRSGTVGNFSSDDFEAYVLCDSPVAAFLDGGTRRHTIEPRNKKILRWEVQGVRARGAGGRFVKGGSTHVIWARRVNHPGTKATKFITGSIDLREATQRLSDVAAKNLFGAG